MDRLVLAEAGITASLYGQCNSHGVSQHRILHGYDSQRDKSSPATSNSFSTARNYINYIPGALSYGIPMTLNDHSISAYQQRQSIGHGA